MASPPNRAPGRLRRLIDRALRAEGGASAVEFALVATPFLMLLFGVIEVALIFMISTSLENATLAASRTIRTGEFQTSGTTTSAAFKTAICSYFTWAQADCSTNLSVDVRTYATFAGVTTPQPVQNGTFNTQSLQFSTGTADDIVVVRAYYKWPLIVPFFDQAFQTLSGGNTLLTSTIAFRNEPYNG